MTLLSDLVSRLERFGLNLDNSEMNALQLACDGGLVGGDAPAVLEDDWTRDQVQRLIGIVVGVIQQNQMLSTDAEASARTFASLYDGGQGSRAYMVMVVLAFSCGFLGEWIGMAALKILEQDKGTDALTSSDYEAYLNAKEEYDLQEMRIQHVMAKLAEDKDRSPGLALVFSNVAKKPRPRTARQYFIGGSLKAA